MMERTYSADITVTIDIDTYGITADSVDKFIEDNCEGATPEIVKVVDKGEGYVTTTFTLNIGYVKWLQGMKQENIEEAVDRHLRELYDWEIVDVDCENLDYEEYYCDCYDD